VKPYIKFIILIILTLTFTTCAEKTTYSGTMFDLKDKLNNFNTKKELLTHIGYPNYIDPIEKKFFYYSEKKISKNFYDNEIIYRKLFVFTFNSNDTIKSINEYDINKKNKIKLVKDQTESDIIDQGLLEKIFGGVGKGATPTIP